MSIQHNLDCFDEFTARFIRSKVRQLVGQPGFKEDDQADLLQDFVLDLLRRRKRFRPETASWEAFVVVVCENYYVTVLTCRRAQMRSHEHEAGSLNQPIYDSRGNRTEPGTTVPDTAHARRTGQYRRSDQEAWELTEDLSFVLEQLSPTMRRVCELLMQDSKAAAARELGIPQGALYDVLSRVLSRFEKAELRDYLA